MGGLLKKFWAWYEKFYTLNLTIAAGLFVLQLAHLYWLTTHVVLFRLFGIDYFFTHSPLVTFLIILADYTEIPALIATSILYARLFRADGNKKHLLYLVFINSQWIHYILDYRRSCAQCVRARRYLNPVKSVSCMDRDRD